MNKFIPSISTVDQILSYASRARTVIINQQPYVARSCHADIPAQPYYSNVIKRVVAAGYVLFGKGMVVRFSEDLYKPSEIITKSYK